MSRLRQAALAAAVLLALAACSRGSGSTGDVVTVLSQLTGQGTSIAFDPTALKMLGLTVKPIGTARLSGSTVLLPVTSGYVELHSQTVTPGPMLGSIQHDTSGFSLAQGKISVSVTNVVLDPGGGMVYGTVDGTTIEPLFTVGAGTTTSADGTLTLSAAPMALSTTLATLLDREFNTHTVSPGTALGTVALSATGTASTLQATNVTETATLPGAFTSITLDSTLAAHLKQLKVTVGTAGPVQLSKSNVLTVPISGGFLGQPATGPLYGLVDHETAGITFNSGSKHVRFSDFALDLGSGTVTSLEGGQVGPFLSLTGTPKVTTTQSTTSTGKIITVDGQTAELTPEAAQVLSHAFGSGAATEGTPLGTVHLTLTTG